MIIYFVYFLLLLEHFLELIRKQILELIKKRVYCSDLLPTTNYVAFLKGDKEKSGVGNN